MKIQRIAVALLFIITLSGSYASMSGVLNKTTPDGKPHIFFLWWKRWRIFFVGRESNSNSEW